jgi:hypothetical protein
MIEQFLAEDGMRVPSIVEKRLNIFQCCTLVDGSSVDAAFTEAARMRATGDLVGGCELRIRPDGAGEVSYGARHNRQLRLSTCRRSGLVDTITEEGEQRVRYVRLEL